MVSAQIPNAGFENWTAGAPNSWLTNNVPTIATPITQSSDAHSGTYSMQGAVISYLTIPYTPTAFAYFTINDRYSSLMGWYKFSPVGGDSLVAFIYFLKNQSLIGFGYFSTGATTSSYTQFTAPLEYMPAAGVPDSAWIEILIIPSGNDVHTGSTFKIDDLTFGPVTGVQESFSITPAVFALSQNYPNPFNPATKISYQIPTDGLVQLEVYNILGKTLETLVNEEKPAGRFTVTFDGSKYTSGIYFYRINVISPNGKSFSQTNKMILMK